MKRRFIQLKESPEYRPGAEITSHVRFHCINHAEFCKFPENYKEDTQWMHDGFIILKQPEFFEEIFTVYLNARQLKKFKTLL